MSDYNNINRQTSPISEFDSRFNSPHYQTYPNQQAELQKILFEQRGNSPQVIQQLPQNMQVQPNFFPHDNSIFQQRNSSPIQNQMPQGFMPRNPSPQGYQQGYPVPPTYQQRNTGFPMLNQLPQNFPQRGPSPQNYPVRNQSPDQNFLPPRPLPGISTFQSGRPQNYPARNQSPEQFNMHRGTSMHAFGTIQNSNFTIERGPSPQNYPVGSQQYPPQKDPSSQSYSVRIPSPEQANQMRGPSPQSFAMGGQNFNTRRDLSPQSYSMQMQEQYNSQRGPSPQSYGMTNQPPYDQNRGPSPHSFGMRNNSPEQFNPQRDLSPQSYGMRNQSPEQFNPQRNPSPQSNGFRNQSPELFNPQRDPSPQSYGMMNPISEQFVQKFPEQIQNPVNAPRNFQQDQLQDFGQRWMQQPQPPHQFATEFSHPYGFDPMFGRAAERPRQQIIQQIPAADLNVNATSFGSFELPDQKAPQKEEQEPPKPSDLPKEPAKPSDAWNDFESFAMREVDDNITSPFQPFGGNQLAFGSLTNPQMVALVKKDEDSGFPDMDVGSSDSAQSDASVESNQSVQSVQSTTSVISESQYLDINGEFLESLSLMRTAGMTEQALFNFQMLLSPAPPPADPIEFDPSLAKRIIPIPPRFSRTAMGAELRANCQQLLNYTYVFNNM